MRFREVYWDTTSDINTLALLTLGQDPLGSLAAVGRFNTRLAEPRQRFSYSSAGSLVLGLALAGATGRTGVGLCERKAVGSAGRRSRCHMDRRRAGAGDHARLLQCGAAGLGAARVDAHP